MKRLYPSTMDFAGAITLGFLAASVVGIIALSFTWAIVGLWALVAG